jgi:hypothetical protein
MDSVELLKHAEKLNYLNFTSDLNDIIYSNDQFLCTISNESKDRCASATEEYNNNHTLTSINFRNDVLIKEICRIRNCLKDTVEKSTVMYEKNLQCLGTKLLHHIY